MRILYIGEIVGSSGVYCVKTQLAALKAERGIDFVIACGDGATGGFGIGKNHSVYLHKLGVDLTTGGECIYYKKDMVPHLAKAPYVLRPANYPPGNPGRGWGVFTSAAGTIGVINLLGQSGFNRVHLSNPYLLAREVVPRLAQDTRTIVVDFHAATTAEKYTMFHFLDGQVTAVLGSHTKVLSADARVRKNGTATIAGTGRTGSVLSVGGLEPEIEIRKFVTQIHEPSRIAWKNLELQGVLVDTDDEGKAAGIEVVRVPCGEAEDDGSGDSEED
jgi:metallophosphoesterase (TIGR00282 family)